ncbi:MAG: alpha/beta hydrolase [Nocardioides sp.]
MPKLNRPGATIHWEERGSGSPLLLIMGTRMSSRMWYPILPLLAQHHRVISFDNRGSGDSSPSEDFTISDLVDDALAVLDAAGVEKAHVYGVSLGGGLALEMGMSHPERVTSLILGCVGPKTEVTPEHKRSSLIWTLIPTWLKIRLTAKAFYGSECDPDARAIDLRTLREDPYDPATVARQGRATGAYSTTLAEVAAVSAPTLVLHGDEDKAVPVEGGRKLAELIPGARLIVYPGAGHNYLVGRGQTTAEHVLDFLAEVDQGNRS